MAMELPLTVKIIAVLFCILLFAVLVFWEKVYAVFAGMFSKQPASVTPNPPTADKAPQK